MAIARARCRSPTEPPSQSSLWVHMPGLGTGILAGACFCLPRPASPPSRSRLHVPVKLAMSLRRRSSSAEELGSPGELGESKELPYLGLLFAGEDAIGDSESVPSPIFSTEPSLDTDAVLDLTQPQIKRETRSPTPLESQCEQGSGTARSQDGFVDDGVSVLSLPPSTGPPLVRIALVQFSRSPLDSQ